MSRGLVWFAGLALLASCAGGASDPQRAPDARVADPVPPADAAEARLDARALLDGAAPDGIAADGGGAEAGQGSGPAAGCPQAPLDLSFLADYQREILGRLAGEVEIEPGLKLANRGTPVTRAAARRYLEGALRALGLTPMSQAYGTGTNVFARLEATTGGTEQVVLGAHFDTVVRSPGANDNASGVALVLAAARALSRLGCRARPLVLVFFDEEEEGLVGAKAFARKLAADGIAVHSVHTADQLGWDSDGDRLVELERPDPGLRALYDEAQRAMGLSFQLVTTKTGGSDHAAFRPAFPAVGITEGYATGDTSPHRHTAMDTPATIDLGYLASATTLVTGAIAALLR
jgi:hypothetical protein